MFGMPNCPTLGVGTQPISGGHRRLAGQPLPECVPDAGVEASGQARTRPGKTSSQAGRQSADCRRTTPARPRRAVTLFMLVVRRSMLVRDRRQRGKSESVCQHARRESGRTVGGQRAGSRIPCRERFLHDLGILGDQALSGRPPGPPAARHCPPGLVAGPGDTNSKRLATRDRLAPKAWSFANSKLAENESLHRRVS